MKTRSVNRSLRLATAFCIAAFALPTFFATRATAEAPGAEPALARAAGDAGLQWSGCPDFLPAGCAIAVLHGDPSKPNVDVFFKVPAKSQIALHTHTSAERMVLVAGELDVTYEGQATARLTPGSYAYGPAGRAHRAACVSDVTCVLFIAFESPLDAMPSGAAGH
ncbi:MAG TPA: cupin domain-containing protein [Steroidobacteraceae bacterium]|jgi:quercetin dioxygenase-like cupin family protein